jgi:hypothetical protein
MIEDTNGGIIRHRSKKDRKYNGKKIEDTNGGIIRHRSKKDRKYNAKILSFFDLCLMIPPLVSSIILPLYFLSFFDLCLMIPPLVSSNRGYKWGNHKA